MRPTLRRSEKVRIEPFRREPRTNDIILYKDDRGLPVVHRVVRVRSKAGRRSYLVRSDVSWYGGDWIGVSQVLGRVAVVMRGERELAVEKLRSKYLWVLLRRMARFAVNVSEGLRRGLREDDKTIPGRV